MTELYLEETYSKILKWYTECFYESFQSIAINYTSWTPSTDIFNSYFKGNLLSMEIFRGFWCCKKNKRITRLQPIFKLKATPCTTEKQIGNHWQRKDNNNEFKIRNESCSCNYVFKK